MKRFFVFCLLLFTVFILQSIHVAYAQEATNPHREDAKRWEDNCKHVARFSQELIFTVRLVEPKGTATNRNDLLNILTSIKVDDVPQVKKKQSNVIAAVKKAPKFTDNFGKSDMLISKELNQSVGDFLTSVSAEADKRGVKCN